MARNSNPLQRGRDAYNDPAFLDARLTETGHSQAASRREELVRASILDDIELVVTSPMMRTIETATAIFGNKYDDEIPLRRDAPSLPEIALTSTLVVCQSLMYFLIFFCFEETQLSVLFTL
jgi:bisphosphoglycerate-dependent phosphoglycerate mutase